MGMACAAPSTYPTGAVARCWAGALTDTSFSVVADFDQTLRAARIVVSVNANYSNPIYTSDYIFPTISVGVLYSYRTIIFNVAGLSAGTKYYYQIQCQNAPSQQAVTRYVTTAPAAHTAAAFTLIVCSCGHTNQNKGNSRSLIYRSQALEGALLDLHFDDLVYSNVETLTPGTQRDTNMRAYMAIPEADILHQTTPVSYVPGDHDMGPNDSTLDTTNAEAIYRNTRLVYGETVPHYPFVQQTLGETNTDHIILTQVFDIGKVRIIQPDCMSQSRLAGGGFVATALGVNQGSGDYWDQRAWLATALTQAGTDYTNGLIEWTIIGLPRGWMWYNQTSFADVFTVERTAILDMIEVCACPVLLMTGDTHCVAFDDGTLAGSFASNAFCRMPFIIASAVFSDTLAAQTPPKGYFWDSVSKFYNLNLGGLGDGLYVTLAFSSNNKVWTATCKGTPINQSTFIPTTIDAVSSDDVTPAVSFNNTTPTVAHGVPLTINLDKTWFGVCSVHWAASTGQSGDVTFLPNRTRATFSVTFVSAGSPTITLSSPSGCTISGTNPITVTVT